MDIVDERITKRCVAVSERGQLFVATGRHFLKEGDRKPLGWYGIGFNGEQIVAVQAEFVADNINKYMKETYNG